MRIFPSAVSAGHDIAVPMPGHGTGGVEGSEVSAQSTWILF